MVLTDATLKGMSMITGLRSVTTVMTRSVVIGLNTHMVIVPLIIWARIKITGIIATGQQHFIMMQMVPHFLILLIAKIIIPGKEMGVTV